SKTIDIGSGLLKFSTSGVEADIPGQGIAPLVFQGLKAHVTINYTAFGHTKACIGFIQFVRVSYAMSGKLYKYEGPDSPRNYMMTADGWVVDHLPGKDKTPYYVGPIETDSITMSDSPGTKDIYGLEDAKRFDFVTYVVEATSGTTFKILGG